MTTTMKLTTGLLLMTAIAPPVVSAQQHPSTSDAMVNAYVAHDVRVSNGNGTIFEGAIASIRDGQLEVLTRGGTQTVALDDIARIERRGDSVKNGFVTGAVIGGVLGLLACVECGGPGYSISAAAVSATMYGLAGAGIDALYDGWTPLYVRENKRAMAGEGTSRALLTMRLRF